MSEAVLFRLRHLEAVVSTNDEVKRALEDKEPEGLAVCARRQTGGYGRQGRRWASPEGGLYLSVLLRPQVAPASLPTLSLVVSLAVCRALSSLVAADRREEILIKWPNDIVVLPKRPAAGNNVRSLYRKLAGISLEAHAGGVCVGIGVNVRQPANEMRTDGGNVPIYLFDQGFSGAIEEVASAILREVSPAYGKWCTEGLAPLLGAYRARLALQGRQVCMVDQAGGLLAEGIVEGVDDCGRLAVRDATGSLSLLVSGEAHLSSISGSTD